MAGTLKMLARLFRPETVHHKAVEGALAQPRTEGTMYFVEGSGLGRSRAAVGPQHGGVDVRAGRGVPKTSAASLCLPLTRRSLLPAAMASQALDGYICSLWAPTANFYCGTCCVRIHVTWRPGDAERTSSTVPPPPFAAVVVAAGACSESNGVQERWAGRYELISIKHIENK